MLMSANLARWPLSALNRVGLQGVYNTGLWIVDLG